jgi:magnesium-protoporphyrin IX monomethyl ester (oxidative) cyclase
MWTSVSPWTKATSPLEKAPLIATFAYNLIAIALIPPVESGSIDINEEMNDPAFMY